jgi:hypothetical protein
MKTIQRHIILVAALFGAFALMSAQAQQQSDEARFIAKEAFIYGFPIVDAYQTLYKQAVDKGGPDFKATFNHIGNVRDVATPAFRSIITPNSDTPYSYIWMDLRAEPIVITMPRIEKGRYYSAQLVDLYTYNFGYLGTRIYGNDGGNFVIAGPGWKGTTPKGVKAVIHCDTQFGMSQFRTQLFNAQDIDNVRKIQDGYKVQTLSAYLGQPAPPAAPRIDWPKLTEDMLKTPALFQYLNFLLQFCPTLPSEQNLMAQFAKINIGAGKTFDYEKLSADAKKDIDGGIADAWEEFAGLMKRVNAGELTSADVFGSREFLKNNYGYRFIAAKLGLFGNSEEEAVYIPYYVDADKKALDASTKRYVMRFEKGELPPVKAFWSLTMYDGKTQFLVANPIDRYLLNSTTLNSYKYRDDGSLTFYIQKESPGTNEESNWLPAPDGSFYLVLRLYLPEPAVFDGKWKPPRIEQAK